MFNPFKFFLNRRVGLALGSGGAKGIAHIAVLEYLEKLGIPVHVMAGSSIGAVVGAVYLCGGLERLRRDLVEADRNKLLSLFDPVFPRSGLLRGGRFIKKLSEYIPPDISIENLRIPFAVVATDYKSGRAVLFKSGNLLNAIRASISIPGIMVPVEYGDTFLIDGGVANPLPVNIVKEMGAGLTIAVNLHPGLGPRELRSFVRDTNGLWTGSIDSREIKPPEKQQELKHDGEARSFLERWFPGRGGREHEHKAPNIFEVIYRSVDIMELVNTMLILKYTRPTVLIEPDTGERGTLDFSEAAAILEEGRLACVKARSRLLRKIAARV